MELWYSSQASNAQQRRPSKQFRFHASPNMASSAGCHREAAVFQTGFINVVLTGKGL